MKKLWKDQFEAFKKMYDEMMESQQTRMYSVGVVAIIVGLAIYNQRRSFVIGDPPDNRSVVTVYYATTRTFDLTHSNWISWLLTALVSGAIFAVVWFFRAKVRGSKVILTLLGLFAGVAFAMTANKALNPQTAYVYGYGRGDVTFGSCEVSIPGTHVRGEMERPRLWKLEFREDPEKHIVLEGPSKMKQREFFDAVGRELTKANDKQILLFVHGFNVSFDEAARRTGQLAFDLPHSGIPIFFSWPSRGSGTHYTADESAVKGSVTELRQFLRDLIKENPESEIVLLAHSMGNRLLTEAVRTISDEVTETKSTLKELILAAPDIDREYFVEEVVPVLLTKVRRITLYASSNDQALALSHSVHDYPRAGDAGRNLVVMPELETIDASEADTSFLGHSYYGSKPRIISDLFLVFRGNKPKDRPGLYLEEKNALPYWFIRK